MSAAHSIRIRNTRHRRPVLSIFGTPIQGPIGERIENVNLCPSPGAKHIRVATPGLYGVPSVMREHARLLGIAATYCEQIIQNGYSLDGIQQITGYEAFDPMI